MKSKILLIMDNITQLNLYKLMLNQSNYHVEMIEYDRFNIDTLLDSSPDTILIALTENDANIRSVIAGIQKILMFFEKANIYFYFENSEDSQIVSGFLRDNVNYIIGKHTMVDIVNIITHNTQTTPPRQFQESNIDKLKKALQQHTGSLALLNIGNINELKLKLSPTNLETIINYMQTELGNNSGTLVYPLSDDYYGVILSAKNTDSAMGQGYQLINTIHKNIGNIATLHVNMGVGVWREGVVSEELLMEAQLSLIASKKKGNQTVQLYNKEMRKDLESDSFIEQEIEHAIRNNEFTLYYQPIVDIHNFSLQGLEVLLRWNHVKKGIIPASKFIKIAEQSEHIHELGKWIFTQTCKQISQWNQQGIEDIKIAVNFSMQQFTRPLAKELKAIIDEYGIDPKRIIIEITENIFVDDEDIVIQELKTMKEYGFFISIDDFGMGYSSLYRLRKFPFDSLKIDQAFTKYIHTSEIDKAIVNMCVGLAHAFQIPSIAEGVENDDQLKRLREVGCMYGQGYLFSAPMDATKCGQWMREHKIRLEQHNLKMMNSR